MNFDPALYDPAEAPCITASGAMDVTLVNGVPSSSACNPNYNPLNGLIFADPPTFNGFVGTKSPYGSKVGKEFNRAIAPRIGIAWDPRGDGRTSVRAGYGMYFDNGLEFGNPELNVGLSQGFLTNLSINRSTSLRPNRRDYQPSLPPPRSPSSRVCPSITSLLTRSNGAWTSSVNSARPGSLMSATTEVTASISPALKISTRPPSRPT